MNKTKVKKSYAKPEIKRIRLDAEVLLVTGCKLASASAARGCRNVRCAAVVNAVGP